MFVKDGILYSDAFKYLYNPKMNAVAFQFKESPDWEERELPSDFDIILQEDKDEGGATIVHRALFCNRLFVATLPAQLDYGSVKTAIIQKRYDYNSQLAIMLNRDNDDKSELLYQNMQSWRGFAAFFARKVMAIVQ